VIQQLSDRMVSIDDELAKINPNGNFAGQEKAWAENGYRLFRAGEYYFKHDDKEKAAFIFKTYLEQFPGKPYASYCTDYITRCGSKFFNPDNGMTLRYPKESVVFAEGGLDNKVYFIRKGTIRISMIGPEGEHVLAIIKKGELFGEMEFLKSVPRLATAIANDDCELVTLSIEDFDKVAADNPNLINQLTYTLAEKIWFSSRMLENDLLKDPVARMYGALSLYLERDRVKDTEQTHTFDFSTTELVKMVHIPPEQEGVCISKLLADSSFAVRNEKLEAKNLPHIIQTANFQRKRMLERQ
jgi:CRP-like cAMP-binding protein